MPELTIHIVIAWTTKEKRIHPDSNHRTDLGECPRWQGYDEPHTVTWLLKGTKEALDKASAHAEQMATMGYDGALMIPYEGKPKDENHENAKKVIMIGMRS